MSRKAWRFSSSEIRRAIDSVKATGLKITSVDIGRDGHIQVGVNDDGDKAKPTTSEPEELRSQL
jgi:hypothetical protein